MDMTGADHMGMSSDSIGGKMPAGMDMPRMQGMTTGKAAPSAQHATPAMKSRGTAARGPRASAGTARAKSAVATMTGAPPKEQAIKAPVKPAAKPAAKKPMPSMPNMPGMSMPSGMNMP